MAEPKAGSARRKLEDEYTIEEALGSGSYAEVYRCTHKETREQFAVKVINKQKAGAKGIRTTHNEVEILNSISHPNIIYIKDYFESSSSMYIVLEVVSGGELFDKIVELRHYSEMLAAKLVRNILTTLGYLHEQHVTHRDLKPENLLLKSKLQERKLSFTAAGEIHAASRREQSEFEDVLTNIKLVDFGFAIRFRPGERSLTECCGTPNFIAPEILEYGIFKTTRQGYNEKADLWSTGVLAYILLCGYPPFHANNRSQMFKKIIDGRYTYHRNTVWDKISLEAKDFIGKLLVTNVDQRLSAAEALQHPWMVSVQQRDDHLAEALTELKIFNARQKFKAAIFGVEATHRILYIARCKDMGIKANSALVKQFPTPEAGEQEEMSVMDLNHNYLGAKGLQAALETIADSTTITTVKLRENQIENQAVTIICERLKNHPTITSIDLSNNPISQLAGRQLLGLIQQNNRIVNIMLEGTYIKPAFMQKITKQLEYNKSKMGPYLPRESTTGHAAASGAAVAIAGGNR